VSFDKGSKDEQPISGDYYPKSIPYYEKFAEKLGGFDISKDAWTWMALVATEDTTKHGQKSVKLYRWNLNFGNWKIGNCNIDVHHLDFEDLKRKMNILKEIYKIN
jgi:hypothetical protein